MNVIETIFSSGTKEVFEEKKISEINDKEKVCITGRLSVSERTHSGHKYFLLMIKDKTGLVTSAVWNTSPLYSLINESYDGQFVQAKGYSKRNDSYLNMDLAELSIVEQEESSTPTIEVLKNEFEKRKESIVNPVLKKIIENAIESNSENIYNAPFSEKTAYAYKGGLLHFTVDMCDMVSKVSECINCGFWNESTIINEEMLLTGAILANLGKSKTLKIADNGVIEKTPLGIMEEDSVISRDIAKAAIDKTFNEIDFKDDTEKEEFSRISMELLHMVSSVKNNPSWGALSSPRSKNALILSNINNIVYSKGLFENMEKDNPSQSFVKAYDNGKTYYIDEKLE